jgi:hypothetical protein
MYSLGGIGDATDHYVMAARRSLAGLYRGSFVITRTGREANYSTVTHLQRNRPSM